MRKWLSILLCALLVAVVLASGGYAAAHLWHHCTGDDCPVCAALDVCEALLRCLFTLLLACGLASAGAAASWNARRTGAVAFAQDTPISRKVKLSC